MTLYALTIPSAARPKAPACSTVKNPCSSVSTKSAVKKKQKSLIYLPRTNFSSRRYALTANTTITARYIKESILSSTVDDLKVILIWACNKMNRIRTLLKGLMTFGEIRKRGQRKPFTGLPMTFGSRHYEVSGQVTAACKDPVAPVALMTGGSFDCAAAGLGETVTPSRQAHRSLGTSSGYSALRPMPLGNYENPVFHLECARPVAHNAQAIVADKHLNRLGLFSQETSGPVSFGASNG